jgi:SNF family Na+-dependent transporter
LHFLISFFTFFFFFLIFRHAHLYTHTNCVVQCKLAFYKHVVLVFSHFSFISSLRSFLFLLCVSFASLLSSVSVLCYEFCTLILQSSCSATVSTLIRIRLYGHTRNANTNTREDYDIHTHTYK